MATETSHHAIDTMLLEERRYPPPEEFAAQANAQPEIYDRDRDEFWERGGARACHVVRAVRDASASGTRRTRSGSSAASSTRRTTASTGTSRPATAPRSRSTGRASPKATGVTSRSTDLQRETTKLANALKSLGVEKGTPVGIYMGMVPEAPIAMLACARIGAPHTVVFGGFSADSLSGRLQDMECEVVITQDEAWRRGTTVPLKKTTDEAVAESPSVEERRRAPAHRRRRADAGGPRPLVARARDRRVRLPVRADGRGGSALPPLHVAARRRSRRGSRTRPPATSSASRRRTTTSSTSSPTRCTGARPTSAGSPATATSSTARSATGRPASCTRARPTSPTRTAGGRSSSATRSTSSTRRRRRSART